MTDTADDWPDRDQSGPLRRGLDFGPGTRHGRGDAGRGFSSRSLRRVLNGNGLGLATARDIVREHNGALEVQSAPGAGTRFDIWLPSVPCLAADIHSAMHRAHAGRGVGETVLVLESGPRAPAAARGNPGGTRL